jgi:diguanylate cyclase (GGDEF)-like protein
MDNETIKTRDSSASSELDSSGGSASPRWGTARLRLLFLAPLAIAIAIIVLVLSMMLYLQASRDVQESVIRIRGSAQEFYDESIRYDANALQAIMHTLKYDKKLSAALAQSNREALLQHAKPLFEDLRRDFNITHFYFTGTDRVNLLRVHAPLRYGDVIERITMNQAESSGSIMYGVELGPLGTFTLRLVSPWYDQQTQNLIGYVELGMEVDHVINKLRDFFGVQVFTIIKKEFLDRDKWEDGMLTLGRTPQWDRFPNEVASEQSMHTIPPLLAERLASGEVIADNNIIDLTYQGLSYRVTVLPLYDAASRAVAQMILLTDVSAEEITARKTVYAGTFTALLVGSVLLVFFYWLVGRIGRRIERNEKELHELATHDGLTGLYNHRVFYSMMEEELARSGRYKHSFSLLMVDIDHFKQVNDTYGHRAGDTILHDLSKRLLGRMRSIDRICRYGGEEISVMLLETDNPTAKTIAEELRVLVEQEPFKIDTGQRISIKVSIGLATFPDHAEDVSLLVANADTALYEAKESGRNRVCVYQAQGTAT